MIQESTCMENTLRENKDEHSYDYENAVDRNRFISKYINAQDAPFNGSRTVYQQALAEIKAACKNSHWIWYIWPQLLDLGHSKMCKTYGIDSLKAACVYLQNPLLRERLIEITEALLHLEETDILKIMWSVDCFKVRSSATLFFIAAQNCPGYEEYADVFRAVILKYFRRIGLCELTINALKNNGEIDPDSLYEIDATDDLRE